jgi:phosphatidylglycerol:prolipoprotein diacylglycerol transferase
MAWVHNLDPFAIQFTETFGIRWYGLAYLTGFILGYWAIVFMTRRSNTGFKEEAIADFITYVAVGVLAGGRIGYVLFYAPDLLTSFDNHFPYWGALKVNEGGMASHGGIIGVMLVCYFYARYNKMSARLCLDLTVFGGSLGFMFGRLANFINGELYGRQAPETLKWAVKFPQEMTLWPGTASEYGRLGSLGPVVEALGQIKTASGEMITVTASTWQGWVDHMADFTYRQHVHEGIESLIRATQSGNTKVTEMLAPILTTRYPSQIYQMFLEGFFVFLILAWIWRKPQKAGVVGGWFGVLYCVARIIGEQYRMPDAHIGYQALGLTRGQWISIAVLLVGIVWLVWAYMGKGPKYGGWMTGTPAEATAGGDGSMKKKKKHKK